MTKLNFLFAGFMLFVVACSPTNNKESETDERLTNYVDPFIGTGFHGHTYPGASYPFGQIQLSPDNGTQGWDWCSGYHYSDSVIAGFSHLHLSGTGIGDLADISFLPTVGEVEFIDGESNEDFFKRYAGKYTHDDEVAEPGYYSVKMNNNGIKAELTVNERVGFHKYVFPEEAVKSLIINLGFTINWDKPYETDLTIQDNKLVTGKRLSNGWAADQHVYFAVRFSKPFINSKFDEVGGEAHTVGAFTFNDSEIFAKVGISSVSAENAIENLDASLTGWDFEATKKAASDAWEKELQKIRIQSNDETQKTIFYTALYHTMVAPALFSDLNGEFKGVEGNTEVASDYKRYTVFSLWDTYRSLHPLLTLFQQERVNDMVKSMLDHYEQTGILPVWELEGNETFCMVGNHSITTIAEAVLKGIGDFDYELALEAMKATSKHDREGMGFHDELGYMPADKIEQSVAKAMEVAIDDYSVALVAQKLGKTEDAEYYFNRAKNYKNYFDPETGFMRGKLSNGEWTTPFDPAFSNHFGSDYTEGNGWQYLWLVPQDVEGLIELLDGKEPFAEKLTQLFELEDALKGEHASNDITGLIGAYAHGNEPSHHTSFLFNYADEAWKTQKINRQIQTEMYTDKPDGICGNEDCGQMSAWYIFSALGFYPVHPAELQYQFGSPIVQKAEIEIAPGKKFTVNAPTSSVDNKYIQKVTLNGEELNRSYITHQEIMDGGIIEFEMGSEPNKSLFAN